MRYYLNMLGIFFIVTTMGCAPVLLGAGAAGGYKVGTDERSVGQIWDDATITAKVKTELAKDAQVKARRIDVDTVDQIVTLTGMLESQKEVDRAVQIAKKVSYVKEVRNYLQIGDKTIGQSLDDKVIGTRIKTKLIGNYEILSLNIDVDVDNRIVTLTGIVNNQKQKDLALDIARKTPGAVKVIDNMKIRGE